MERALAIYALSRIDRDRACHARDAPHIGGERILLEAFAEHRLFGTRGSQRQAGVAWCRGAASAPGLVASAANRSVAAPARDVLAPAGSVPAAGNKATATIARSARATSNALSTCVDAGRSPLVRTGARSRLIGCVAGHQ